MIEHVAETNKIPPVPQSGEKARTRAGHVVRQFAKKNVRTGKYAVVGIAAMAVSFAVFNLMFWWTHALTPSSLAAFFVSATFGFLCQRSWTFADRRGKSAFRQYGETILVNCAGTAAGTVVTAALLSGYAQIIGQHASSFGTVFFDLLTRRTKFPLIVVDFAAYSTAAVVMLWNYLSLTRWVFKR